jgi:hypothetical protein
MSALEKEIIEKFQMLDHEAQQRIRERIEQLAPAPSPVTTLRTWLAEADQLRTRMSEKYGDFNLSIADLINEVREERLNDILVSLYKTP